MILFLFYFLISVLILGENLHIQSYNEIFTSKSDYEQFNTVCRFNVSQTNSETFQTVSEALNQTCTQSEGYEIVLIDLNHIEHLLVNKSLPVQIKGGINNSKNKAIPTIWKDNVIDSKQIISLQNGNLTLENIQFNFTILTNQQKSFSPSYCLIYVGNDIQFPSLTVQKCKFYSVTVQNVDYLLNILVFSANNVQIINCIFEGIGLNDSSSNITMICSNNCSSFSIQDCAFFNANISAELAAVQLYGEINNSSISVKNCEFLNIWSIDSRQNATLCVVCTAWSNVEIIGNKFQNCCNNNKSLSGALYIFDGNTIESINNFTIRCNTFIEGFGNYSGGIFFKSKNNQSLYNFTNNIFQSNKNQQNLGIGKDAFLSFINTSSRWNDSSVEGIIKYLFDGSTSDGSNGSIYYEIQNIDKLIKYGNITLPKSPNKQQLSVIVIVGIVIGSVVFVITTIVIIVIIVQCRKRKSKSGYLRNISSFHDPLGSYRSL